jgi:hypothetical protein
MAEDQRLFPAKVSIRLRPFSDTSSGPEFFKRERRGLPLMFGSGSIIIPQPSR